MVIRSSRCRAKGPYGSDSKPSTNSSLDFRAKVGGVGGPPSSWGADSEYADSDLGPRRTFPPGGGARGGGVENEIPQYGRPLLGHRWGDARAGESDEEEEGGDRGDAASTVKSFARGDLGHIPYRVSSIL